MLESYGLEREKTSKHNEEIRYILFVDECDQISNNSLIHDPNKLRFLKECLEGSESSREYEIFRKALSGMSIQRIRYIFYLYFNFFILFILL